MLDELLDYWKTQAPRKPKTVHEFTTAVRRFTELHGNMPASDIEKRHVVAFKDKLIAEGRAHGTVKKQLGALVARIDVGFSPEETGLVYLTFGHTF